MRIEEQTIKKRNMANVNPTVTPNIQRPKAGFNDYAERLNGRAAMVGFVLVVLIELVTGKGILSWLGLG
jgi:hypothetical protein